MSRGVMGALGGLWGCLGGLWGGGQGELLGVFRGLGELGVGWGGEVAPGFGSFGEELVLEGLGGPLGSGGGPGLAELWGFKRELWES